MRIIAQNKEERIEVCSKCPLYNSVKNKCEQCGCNLAIKALYAGSRCPLNKWGCKECEVK